MQVRTDRFGLADETAKKKKKTLNDGCHRQTVAVQNRSVQKSKSKRALGGRAEE